MSIMRLMYRLTINYHQPTATYRELYEICIFAFRPFHALIDADGRNRFIVVARKLSRRFSIGSLAFVIARRMHCNLHKSFPYFNDSEVRNGSDKYTHVEYDPIQKWNRQ